MEGHEGFFSSARPDVEEMGVRRGPWTEEEDLMLINCIAKHGEGRWNSLALCSGLKRTGKSCRLRWLNYLRPDLRRGNITPEEQLLILVLHSQYGNRWSKIAQHLPGRTDNEIKNYWRTRVQKHAKHLQCDVNSEKFKCAMQYLWMPRLLERIHAASSSKHVALYQGPSMPHSASIKQCNSLENSVITGSSEFTTENQFSVPLQLSMDSHVIYDGENKANQDAQLVQFDGWWSESLSRPSDYIDNVLLQNNEQGNFGEDFWTVEDLLSLQE